MVEEQAACTGVALPLDARETVARQPDGAFPGRPSPPAAARPGTKSFPPPAHVVQKMQVARRRLRGA